MMKIAFERIIEEFQDAAGSSKSELTYLMLIEDKLTDICEFARPEIKRKTHHNPALLDLFASLLQDKINKMRS